MRDLYRKSGSDIWYGQFKEIDGRRRQVCLHTTDRAEATRRLRLRSSTTSKAPAHAPTLSLSDCLSHFVARGCRDRSPATVRFYRQRAEQLVRVAGGLDVNAATKSDWQVIIDKRLDEGASRSTVYKELVTIRQAMSHAIGRGVAIASPDLPDFSADYKPRRRWLSDSKALELLSKAPERRRLWILVAVWSGLRLSEVEGLKWSDVDLGRRWMLSRGTKTKKSERHLPIAPELLSALEAVPSSRRRGLVVGPWPSVRRFLRRHYGISPNDLRRTFASLLKNRGVDSAVVAKLLGHTSTRMVDLVYGHLADETLERAVSLLPSTGADNGRQEDSEQNGDKWNDSDDLAQTQGLGTALRRRL